MNKNYTPCVFSKVKPEDFIIKVDIPNVDFFNWSAKIIIKNNTFKFVSLIA